MAGKTKRETPPSDPKDIERGANLQKARTARGISQSQLADTLGTTGQYISNVERGRQHATLDWLQRAAEATGAKLSDIAREVK